MSRKGDRRRNRRSRLRVCACVCKGEPAIERVREKIGLNEREGEEGEPLYKQRGEGHTIRDEFQKGNCFGLQHIVHPVHVRAHTRV